MLAIAHEPVTEGRELEGLLERLARLAGIDRRVVSILDPIERNVEELNRFRPDVVMSFGSYLEALFVHLDASGRAFHHPAAVIHGGDAISAPARRLITETLGIPVLSLYGSYEAFPLGFECAQHRGHHMNVDLFPIRLVDSAGEDVSPGESGEVVISNLLSRGTMLLNYRLGDIARWIPGPCPCGRNLPVLSFVQGRVADWLTTPAGERLHPQTVTVVLEVDPDVLRYQVVQRQPSRLEIKLVARAGSDLPAVARRVQTGFANLLPEIAVDVLFVADLPRTRVGKTRNVVGLEAADSGP